MAPVRRNRHDTSSASGHQDQSDSNHIIYGTRSKRKVSEMSSPESSPSDQKTSTNSSQNLDNEEAEFAGPPAKKSKKASSETPPKTPEPEQDMNEFDIPDVKVDGPSDSSSDEQNHDQANGAPSGRGAFGRGRGRGRGGRGRGRGGRGGSGLGSRGTPVAESPVAPKAMRGRGGHRVKKSDNARIQALYHRRAALKHQYKQVASFQKIALLVLAEKSLYTIKGDAQYHETLPEYTETTQALNDAYQKRIDKLNSEYALRKDYLQRQLTQNSEYAAMQFLSQTEEIREIYDAKVMEKAIHVCRQWFSHQKLENTPYYRPVDDKVVKRLHPPPTIVHSIATPYNWTLAEDRFQNEDVPEQHPADQWLFMTPDQKSAADRKMQKASGDKRGRIKNSKGSALYQPQAAVTDTPDMPELPALLPDLPSAAPTPAEVSGEDTETDNTEAQGEEQPTDQFGVKVPKKPTPRNGEAPQNRIVGDAPVTFDQDEIGIRKHHVRKNNRNEQQYLGMDPDPNPKRVHYDQVARGHNSSRNKKEDLDEAMVETFNVHPIYGLPLPNSRNPTHDECVDPPFRPPTDWSKDLAPTSPVVVIEETSTNRKLLDQDKRVFLTSRSEWIIQNEAEWEQVLPKLKMNSMLTDISALDPPRPTTPEQVAEEEPESRIDEELLSAVNEAESERVDSLKIKVSDSPAPKPLPPQFSPRVSGPIQHYSPVATMHAPAPAPQRSQGYDPVRDTGYQTPYQPVAPKPQPAPSVINQTSGLAGLVALADAADTRTSVPSFREYRPPQQNSWAAAPSPSQHVSQHVSQHPPQHAPQHRPPPPHSTFVPYSGPAPSRSPYTSPRAPALPQNSQVFHGAAGPQGPNIMNRAPGLNIMNGVQLLNGMNHSMNGMNDMSGMNGPQRLNGFSSGFNPINGPQRHDDMMNGHMAQSPVPGGPPLGPSFRELRPAPPQNRSNLPPPPNMVAPGQGQQWYGPPSASWNKSNQGSK